MQAQRFTLNMVKFNPFEAAMGFDPWEIHTVADDFASEGLAVLTAKALATLHSYAAAEISDGYGIIGIGQMFRGELVWGWNSPPRQA